MRKDNGWIHTLVEEAENERMHLLTFLQLRQPGLFFRGMVLLSQVWKPPKVQEPLRVPWLCCERRAAGFSMGASQQVAAS